MKSLLLSRRDLDFLLFEWLAVDELTKRERFAEHSRETFDAVLDLCEQLAQRYFAPHNKTSDANEPTFDGDKVTIVPEVKEAWDAFAEADLIPMSMDQRLGGAQLPASVAQAGFAWFSAANVSTTGYLMLTMANGVLVNVEAAVNVAYGYDIRGEVLGETGTIELAESSKVVIKREGQYGGRVPVDWRERFLRAYDTEFQEWLDAVAAGRSTGPSSWDGYAATLVCDAATEAYRTGAPATVTMREKPDLYVTGGAAGAAVTGTD